MIKVSQNDTLYVLAIPTIINSDVSLNDIQDIINAGSLALKGSSNLAPSYSGTTYDIL
jgi:hypothetical protein